MEGASKGRPLPPLVVQGEAVRDLGVAAMRMRSIRDGRALVAVGHNRTSKLEGSGYMKLACRLDSRLPGQFRPTPSVQVQQQGEE